jgi:hypothetical protein
MLTNYSIKKESVFLFLSVQNLFLSVQNLFLSVQNLFLSVQNLSLNTGHSNLFRKIYRSHMLEIRF